jgi:hypothetical protein
VLKDPQTDFTFTFTLLLIFALQAYIPAKLAILIDTLLWRVPQMKLLFQGVLKTFKAESKTQKAMG